MLPLTRSDDFQTNFGKTKGLNEVIVQEQVDITRADETPPFNLLNAFMTAGNFLLPSRGLAAIALLGPHYFILFVLLYSIEMILKS